MVLHARLVWWVGTVSQAKVGYMARRCFQNLDWAFFRSHRLYSTWGVIQLRLRRGGCQHYTPGNSGGHDGSY